MRKELMSFLGGRTTNALLRAMTRDGRLYPGTHPKVEGPVVNADHGEDFTPADELARMLEGNGARDCGSSFLW